MNPEFLHENARAVSRVVLRWGRVNFQDYPWRAEKDHWLALIAEILLSRTRAAAVLPIWMEFRKRYPNPRDLIVDDGANLEELLAPLGLNWRVALIRKLADELSDGDVPVQISELEKLPAVGPYVAAAHSSLHRNQRGVIIDSNVVRWISRLVGVVPGPETRRERWMAEMADGLTPKTVFRDYNYAVLDLSMTICVTQPKCNMCPVLKFCNYGSRKS